MNHFLDINSLTIDDARHLIARALQFKQNGTYPCYDHYTVAHLFYENSTRTRVSFEMAAQRLRMPVVNLDVAHSSEQKGEVLTDTVATLVAMGVSIIVIRHSQEGIVSLLANRFQHQNTVHFVNAGDGQRAHPSQAMLDMMTILEHKADVSPLKIALLGDIRHSRVAHSWQYLAARFNVGELVMIAPKPWQPVNTYYGFVTDSLEDGLKEADVIITLRVQRERLLAEEELDMSFYKQHYTLTEERLSYAKKDAIIMHPGPMNRGIDIDSVVADGPQSVILQQVSNGLFMRMAILEAVLQ